MRRIPKNYAEARELADAARARAYAIHDQCRAAEERHRDYIASLRKHQRPQSEIPFDVAVDRRAALDPRWKAAVADNRWYIDYATMYGQGELIDAIGRLTQVLRHPTFAPRGDHSDVDIITATGEVVHTLDVEPGDRPGRRLPRPR